MTTESCIVLECNRIEHGHGRDVIEALLLLEVERFMLPAGDTSARFGPVSYRERYQAVSMARAVALTSQCHSDDSHQTTTVTAWMAQDERKGQKWIHRHRYVTELQ